MVYERAYCLYCLNDFEKATFLLENQKSSDLRNLELLAQIVLFNLFI